MKCDNRSVCEGCEKGLPVITGFVGGIMTPLAAQRLHYQPGSEQPAGVCSAPIMDSIADEVMAWEGEGGRA